MFSIVELDCFFFKQKTAYEMSISDWSSDVCSSDLFKILSLDGGGIKGIYSAQFLARCEQELTTGKPLASYFDMIAGTSTGGIIALGLALGYSTSDILDFYTNDGRRIFPPLPTARIGRWWRGFSWL